jgi:hypothetical protein
MSRTVLHLHISVLVRLLTLPVLGTSAVAQVQSPANLAGCYSLTLGTWSPPLRHASASQTPPRHLRLDTVPAVRSRPQDSLWAVHPSTLVARGRWPASWRLRAADSALVVWSTGFSGVRLHLRIFGDSLRGEAATFSDARIIGDPPEPRASVDLVRETCK